MKYTLFLALITTSFLLFNFNLASALTISPVKVDVIGDPGQTLRGEMELYNEQSEPKTLFSSFENFEPEGETGSPRFIGGTEGLATWLKTEGSITVQPGEKIIVPYTITIPPEAEPGGYFSAIFWGTGDPETQEAGEVSVGGKIGVLLLLRVSGDIEESAGLSDYEVNSGRFFVTSMPVLFSFRFTNSGADRVVPLGDITIKNTFNVESAKIKANLTEGNVLPSSSRKFQTKWGEDSEESAGFFAVAKRQLKDFHFGLYSAKLDLVYGATNQSTSETVRFIFFPWQLLSLISVGLISAYFGLRKYNSWIISKSKQG